MNEKQLTILLGFVTGVCIITFGFYIIMEQMILAENITLSESDLTQNYLIPVSYQSGCFNPLPFIIIGVSIVGTILYYVFLNRNWSIK